MIRSQNEASAVLYMSDTQIAAASTVSGYVDTLDYDYCTIDICATTADVTSNIFTTLDLSEGLVSNAYTAIAAYTGTAAAGYTINPVADTSDAHVVARFNVDCSKYERYLRVQMSPQTTQSIVAIARLGYKDEADTTTAALGAGATVTA